MKMKACRLTSIFLALTLLLNMCSLIAGEGKPKKETKEEIEAREAEAEEIAERDQLGKAVPTTFAGKLVLNPINPGESQAQVVGSFSVEKGGLFPVKLRDPNLLKVLRTYDGKLISVYGKLRNQGKYLVISGVIAPAPTPKGFAKRGGF